MSHAKGKSINIKSTSYTDRTGDLHIELEFVNSGSKLVILFDDLVINYVLMDAMTQAQLAYLMRAEWARRWENAQKSRFRKPIH